MRRWIEKQAHAAYEQLTDFVTKAMDAWMGAMPSSPMAKGFKYVQDRATEIAMENAEAASTFVSQISDARTFQDIVTLQTQFAQDRMKAFVTHTQQLYSLIGEALQKSERGAMGAPMGAMPSNTMVTGFNVTGSANIHDRVVEIAKENADSAFALAEKIAKAQTLQDILTLQTQFAQEQIQAYAAQTDGLQGLIGKAFRKL
jgi:hypothetical protein